MAGGGGRLEEDSIGDLVGRLIADGREFVGSEIRLQKANVVARVIAVRTALILGVVGLLLVASSLVGILVGCTIALARWLGPAGAGLIVTLLTLALAGLLFWLAARSLGAAGKTDLKKSKSR